MPNLFDSPNLLDNGDGTYTDLDTGDLYDSTGQQIFAVPNQSPLDYQNTVATTGGVIDTAAGPANSVPPAQSGGFLDGIDSLIHSIESGFTNLYVPAVKAGIITTPATNAANASAALNTQAERDQQAADSKQKTLLIVGGLLIVALWAFKSAAKA